MPKKEAVNKKPMVDIDTSGDSVDVELEDKISMINVINFSTQISVNAPIVKSARVVNSRTNGNFQSWRTTQSELDICKIMLAL